MALYGLDEPAGGLGETKKVCGHEYDRGQERLEPSCGGNPQCRGPKVPMACSGSHVHLSPAHMDILSRRQAVANSMLATSVVAGPEQLLAAFW